MAAITPIITIAGFLKWEAPGGDVLLSDGGIVDFGGERYGSDDSVFGTIQAIEAISVGFGDTAESGKISFAPKQGANWWRDGLLDTRIRMWMGEVDGDGHTVTTATIIADFLVDNAERTQAAGGADTLTLDLMARSEKLFLINEGNICSERFHTTVWPGELGFRNCTDLVGFVPWGAQSAPRSTGGGNPYGAGNPYGIPSNFGIWQ